MFDDLLGCAIMLDGIMYMVPFIYAGVRLILVLPLAAIARHGTKNSNPVSTDR